MAHLRTPLVLIVALAGGLSGCMSSIEAAQTNPDPAQEIARANALVQAGKPEAAILIFKQLVAAYPSEVSIGINLAIAQFKADRYRDTILECQRLLGLQPNLFPALLFLGASRLKIGDAASAIEPLRQALSINPNDPNARIMLADALLGNQQHREAAGQYLQAAQTLGDSPRTWYGLHLSYVGWASEILQRLEQTAPASAEFLALSGEFERDRLQPTRAFQYYRQALALRPAFRGLHSKLAELYDLTGHADWARVERTRESAPSCSSQSQECDFVAGRIQAAAASTSASPDSLYWQGLAIRVLAERAFAHLQHDLPASHESYEAAAEFHERGASYQQAVVAWKQALALAPGDRGIQRRLALSLCHANDCVSALPLLKDLLAKAPDSAELNYLCGLALNATRDPGQARPYLEMALRIDDKFLPAHAALGEALLETGNAEQAIPHLEAAVAEDETGVLRYQLARAFQAAGKRAQADAVLREYRAILSRRTAGEKDEPRITAP